MERFVVERVAMTRTTALRGKYEIVVSICLAKGGVRHAEANRHFEDTPSGFREARAFFYQELVKAFSCPTPSEYPSCLGGTFSCWEVTCFPPESEDSA